MKRAFTSTLLAATVWLAILGGASLPVLFTPNGKTYHANAKCVSLARSKAILKAPEEDAKKHGLTPCAICYRPKAVKTRAAGRNAWAEPAEVRP
jgi:hypothetical protein